MAGLFGLPACAFVHQHPCGQLPSEAPAPQQLPSGLCPPHLCPVPVPHASPQAGCCCLPCMWPGHGPTACPPPSREAALPSVSGGRSSFGGHPGRNGGIWLPQSLTKCRKSHSRSTPCVRCALGPAPAVRPSPGLRGGYRKRKNAPPCWKAICGAVTGAKCQVPLQIQGSSLVRCWRRHFLPRVRSPKKQSEECVRKCRTAEHFW